MPFILELPTTHPDAVRQKVNRVNQCTRHIHGLHFADIPKGGVIAICLVRNGGYYIQAFINHYLRIGVTHLVFMDNGSTDNTIAIASKYDQVTITECRLPFRDYKLAMRTYMAEAFRNRNWILSVDIDEFWEHPLLGRLPLNGLLHYLEDRGFNAVVAQQLDLFSGDTIPLEGVKPKSLENLCYYDLSDVLYWHEEAKNLSACPDQRIALFYSGNELPRPAIPVLSRGVRWRLFGISPILTKLSLFYLTDSVVPFTSSSHKLKGACIADISCVLLHMLLNQDLIFKAAWCAKEESYYNRSAHYKRIADRLTHGPIQMPPSRKEYQSVDNLVSQKFLSVSPAFEDYVQSSKYVIPKICHTEKTVSLPLHIPLSQPRGVFEHLLNGIIEVTNESADIADCRLDTKGYRRYTEYEELTEIEAVIGIARLQWKSPAGRVECIKLQRSKNKQRPPHESRWTEIASMANAIKKGAQLPLPALVHPKLHNSGGLRIIDGARRIIANVEAAKPEFRVSVIKPKS